MSMMRKDSGSKPAVATLGPIPIPATSPEKLKSRTPFRKLKRVFLPIYLRHPIPRRLSSRTCSNSGQ